MESYNGAQRSVACDFTNCNGPHPFGENSRPSITKNHLKEWLFQRCKIGSVKLAVYLSRSQTGVDLVLDEARENVRQTFVRTPRKSVKRASYSKIWTEILFFKKMGHFRSSIARLLRTSVARWLLDWTGWKDSLATTIAWFNPPGLLCVGDMLKTKFLFHLFLQVWKSYGDR